MAAKKCATPGCKNPLPRPGSGGGRPRTKCETCSPYRPDAHAAWRRRQAYKDVPREPAASPVPLELVPNPDAETPEPEPEPEPARKPRAPRKVAAKPEPAQAVPDPEPAQAVPESEAPPPAPQYVAGPLETVTLVELAKIDRHMTPIGVATLLLARKLDHTTPMDTGSQIAALNKEYRAALEQATAGIAPKADAVDDFTERRKRKAEGAA